MRVAVFDLDGTLTRRDLYLAFLAEALRRLGPARPLRLAGLPWLTARHLLRGIGNDRLKAAYLDAVLGGRSREAVTQLADRFAARAVEREIKPAALNAVAQHRRAGDMLLLASASLDVYVRPIAAALGFDAAVATRVAWTAEGRIAGTLDGPNLRGPAKLDAVQAALAMRAEAGAARFVAYSDHESDAALLAAAEEAVAVDPTRAMRRLAAQRGWQVVDWSAVPSGAGRPAAAVTTSA
ncbi:HAD family hydrolase [Falsiroseomonas oryzae]|uniref:HAD family hydrolase n=1 Tax=Falsiroseomonas oryzae TaxID=2766473 RepID=UPI0022EB489B|nr:HAD-IB family hydrolase [Roseomonas sp. MO-31]